MLLKGNLDIFKLNRTVIDHSFPSVNTVEFNIGRSKRTGLYVTNLRPPNPNQEFSKDFFHVLKGYLALRHWGDDCNYHIFIL